MAMTSDPELKGVILETFGAGNATTAERAVPKAARSGGQDNSELDIRGCWGIGDGPNFLVFPNWVVPVDNNRWAPLYGAWYKVIGTEVEGTELDLDPLERTPAREDPNRDLPRRS